MQAQQRLSTIIAKVYQKFRVILITGIFIYIIAKTMDSESVLQTGLGIMLTAACMALLWIPAQWKAGSKHVLMVTALWLANVSYWVLLHGERPAIALMFFLIGYAAYKLPTVHSISLVIAVIATNTALLLMMKQVGFNELLLNALTGAGIYGLFWGARMRREANESSRRHLEELSHMHARLELAYEELQRTHRELEEATARSQRYAVLEERTRIARDIHDSIGHGLTSVIVQLQALPYVIKVEPGNMDQTISNVLDVARNCLKEVRLVVHQMANEDSGNGPTELQNLIRNVQQQSGLPIKFTCAGPMRPWNTGISELMYRLLQEALTNVIRHAEAAKVEIDLYESREMLVLSVKDDGIYTKDTELSPGFGMSGMIARCERIGGSCQFEPCDPHGLGITFKVPLTNRHEKGDPS
ncbi:sensor histidine kinase [Paenibacillus planticolens]|uniref:histidine kinase n=1 Tax=Paenibacillus planticolens TaxID=2654976 RepID=A0ABX1ZWA9_9BACL|nr:sensor histidine kinase [Paenibacillus planticolens]NOV04329.1 sensor histidine kinase [Paenibacillus planticolens]